jgi:hypothetical protein
VAAISRRNLTVVVAFFVSLLVAAPAMAQRYGGHEDAGREIAGLTNHDRMRHGLAPLEWNAGLERSAEAHLQWMLHGRALMHQYPGEAALPERARRAGVAFSEVAENLAAGFDPESVEVMWMHSPPHRRNILDPGLNAVGVATAWLQGRLYVVEDFANVIASRGPREVERRVGELLRRQGIDPDGPRQAAEQACRSEHGIPGGGHVRLVIRFQTPHLNQLPEGVLEVLRRRHYTRAAVGACAPEGAKPGFTTFRVALLLY